MIFPQLNAPLRNDRDFRAKLYEGHHKSISILEDIQGLDMIKDFPIGDSLHLIDLGIMKRFLTGWKSGSLGNKNAKWSSVESQLVSDFMIKCKMPKEIRRPIRGLEHLPRWKGTEFRTFLLYVSIVVINKFFSCKDIYEHFLNFFCAIHICVRQSQSKNNYQIARFLLSDFLEGVKLLYGNHMFCSNMHSLTHLIDDVERFGSLDTFDAYPFESKLYGIKRMMRSGNLPLSQVARRVVEIQQNLHAHKPFNPEAQQYCLSSRNKITRKELLPSELFHFIEKEKLEPYTAITLSHFCIDTKNKSDCWILSKQYEVIMVTCIMCDASKKYISFYGNALQNQYDYFLKPINSSALQIYASDLELQASQVYSINDIFSKMVSVRTYDKNLPKYVFIPLIHTMN